MSNIRRKTAEHLAHAWNDDSARHAARQGRHHRARGAAQAVRAEGRKGRWQADDDGDCAQDCRGRAASKFPQFNSSIDVARNEIVYKKSMHVGVAADTERGLLVPVIRDVDRKGIFQLAAELGAASEKARAGKLSLDDFPIMLPSIEQRLSLELAAKPAQVAAAIALLDEGATVPFIARYRKEATGGLDDTQLRLLEERLSYLRELEERRAAIIASIEEQGKMTPALLASIDAGGRQDAAGRPVSALQEKAPHQGANRAGGRA